LPAIAGRRPAHRGKRFGLRDLTAHRFFFVEFHTGQPDERFRRIDIRT
jgi:hypothetical protein